MNTINPILSICIPTYNRMSYLSKLLSFLELELEDNNRNIIEIIISDNCSTDNTENIVREFLKKTQFAENFTYNRNIENIGAEGNFRKLHSIAKGQYEWLMGDDDLYHSGILKFVLQEVLTKKYTLIFINHCLYNHNKEEKGYIPSMLDGIDASREDKEVLFDILEKYGTCFMFVSATVHKRENIEKLGQAEFKVNMSYTLLKSFYSASKGKVKLIKEVLIDDICGNIGWSDKMTQVFSIDVPYVLRQAPSMNYNYYRFKEVYIEYLHKQGLPAIWPEYLKFAVRHPRWFLYSLTKNRYIIKNLI